MFGQNTATPLKGEGTGAFLIRNNCSGKKNHQKFLDLNRGKLGKNNTLKFGVTYRLPSSSQNEDPEVKTEKNGNEPLFGKKYAKYTINSNRLEGACFFLSSGHGGPDSGATNTTYAKGVELHEDEYAYDITLRLARVLLMEGAEVHIIIQDAIDGIRDEEILSNSSRETCMGAPIPKKQRTRLEQRCNKINDLTGKSKAKHQRAVFIHLDSRENKNERIDVYFYHWKKSEGGKLLANAIRDTFQEKYNLHQPGRGYAGKVKTEDDTRNFPLVLINTKPVSVFLELGNIQNDKDLERFLKVNNRQAVANWIRDGLIKDYENSKKVKKQAKDKG